jgi:hypothetical protein
LCLEINIPSRLPSTKENQSDPEEDEYESPRLVYCKEINAMVPLVKVGL